MSVYIIALLKFTDVDRYRRYQKAFPEVFAKSNGTVVIADETPRRVEGDWTVDKVVVLGFPSEADAEAFQESPEYQAISKDRKAGADAAVFMVRGLDGPMPVP
jgi:uncharacterized protein (DUF1330 family)